MGPGVVIDMAAARAKREAPPEPWLRKDQAATHLGVTPRTVTAWQQLGLPFRHVGGTNLYKRSELDAWVEREVSGR